MATYISTVKFSSQGMTGIQDTIKRAAAFKSAAKKHNVKIKEIFWTLGAFDGMLIFEAPDDETATAVMLHLGAQGNVATQTCRAFNAAEMEKILKSVAG